MMNSPLQTDLYQLTMSAAYHAAGKHQQRAAFHLFFRRAPFKGSYAIAAGLESALQWMEDFRFDTEYIRYLAAQRTPRGDHLFKQEFLDYLGKLQLELDVHAVREGTLVFPHEPILRIEGPLLHAQLVETALLNIINFQTLIATKAARVCHAAEGDPVIEFGYRRAQGPDGALMASRASYIGGCAGTSNVHAGQQFHIPIKGTHAHSWVMSFDHELEAFRTYARCMPDNSTLLVDTYDTIQGVKNAIIVARELAADGHQLSGIRLDSGDLAWLSQKARAMFDDAGFPDVKIVASNDLDEHLVTSLKEQGARIDIWGVGTNLVTASDQPALGGVYKLAALEDTEGKWLPCIKRSEQAIKSSIPGRQQVRRFRKDGKLIADAIHCIDDRITTFESITSPENPLNHKTVPADAEWTDLLEPVMIGGKRELQAESLETIRARREDELAALDPTIQRLDNPHLYPAGLEPTLANRRTTMLSEK